MAIQHKRGTAAAWAAQNPVLADGQLGWDRTNKRLKMGNGSTPWNSNNDYIDMDGIGGSGSPGVGLGTNVQEFDASGSAVTTTGSITSGQNTLTVASAAGYAIGQGVFVEGAGSQGSGNDLVASITNIAGNVLTLSANATATVAGALVMHDDTDAIQAAIDSLFASDGPGGWLYFPAGHYRCNKGFRQTLYSGDTIVPNAILSLPWISGDPSTGKPMKFFGMWGEYATRSIWGKIAENGVIISTILNGTGTVPALLAARGLSGTSDWVHEFNYINCRIENIRFQVPDNSTTTAVMMANAVNFTGKGIVCEVASHPFSVPEPTNDNVAVWMPSFSNNTKMEIEVYAIGYETGLKISEHVYIHPNTLAYRCADAVTLTGGGHLNSGTFSAEHCKRWLTLNNGEVGIVDFNIKVEKSVTGWWTSVTNQNVYDPGDKLHGRIQFLITDEGSGPSPTSEPSITGCTDVQWLNLFKPGNAFP